MVVDECVIRMETGGECHLMSVFWNGFDETGHLISEKLLIFFITCVTYFLTMKSIRCQMAWSRSKFLTLHDRRRCYANIYINWSQLPLELKFSHAVDSKPCSNTLFKLVIF
jgi:hypothetical protein